MSKNSKFRRDKKRKKQTKVANKNKGLADQKVKVKSLVFPEFLPFDSPFNDLNVEERKVVIEEIIENSTFKMSESIQELNILVRRVYPIYLLSLISKYGLVGYAGDNGVETNKGFAEQYQVEFLQAFILSIPIDKWGQDIPNPHDVQVAFDLLDQISESHTFSSIWDSKIIDLDENEASAKSLSKYLQIHTKSVRNWGYYSQVNTISKELFSDFDVPVEERFGFSCSDVIDFFNFQVKFHEDSMTEDFQKLTELKKLHRPKVMLEKYLETLGQEDSLEATWKELDSFSHKQTLSFIMSHMDLKLIENSKLNIDDITNQTNLSKETVQTILEYFSIEATSEGVSVEDVNYFWLDNPVWLKPILKVEKYFYCPIPQVFFSFILLILDNLVREVVNVQKVNKRRAKYLEQKLKEVVLKRFPETKTIEGFEWQDNGQRFETDLVTFIDSYAIIFEAKSHKISQSALRGGKDRAKRHLKEIVVAPNKQALRFQKKLEWLIENPEDNDPLRESLPVDLNKTHKILRVSVTLESLAYIQTNLLDLKKAGWIPGDYSPSPNMSISDFEIVFDLIEHPVQILHYLEKRIELESGVTMMGDELDFLGTYLKTLLNLDFPSKDGKSTIINLSGESAPVDKYYDSLSHNIVIEKPKILVSPMFSKIFKQLESRSTDRWSEVGVLLSRVLPEDQYAFAKLVKDLEKIVHKRWMIEGHKNILVYQAGNDKDVGIAMVLYKDSNQERRHEFIDSASRQVFAGGRHNKAVLIARNIDKGMAYDFIAIVENIER